MKKGIRVSSAWFMLLFPFPTSAPHFTGPVSSWTGSRVQRWRLGEMFSGRHCKGFQPKPIAALHALGYSSFRHSFWSQEKMQFPARHHLPPSSPCLPIWHSHPCKESMSSWQGGETQCQREGKDHAQALLATGDTQHETRRETRHPDSTASSYKTFPPCEAAGKRWKSC